MKLIKFNTNTAKSTRTGESTIRLHSSGLITISKEAAQAIGLVAGDPVSIGQDPDNPDDWYIYLDKESGFTTREAKNNNGLCFSSAFIFKSYCSAYDIDCTSVSIKIAKQSTKSEDPELKGVKLWGILTHTAKFNAKKQEVADE